MTVKVGEAWGAPALGLGRALSEGGREDGVDRVGRHCFPHIESALLLPIEMDTLSPAPAHWVDRQALPLWPFSFLFSLLIILVQHSLSTLSFLCTYRGSDGIVCSL